MLDIKDVLSIHERLIQKLVVHPDLKTKRSMNQQFQDHFRRLTEMNCMIQLKKRLLQF